MSTRKESAFAAIARTSHPFAHQLAHPLSVPARVYRLGLDLDSIHEIPVARTAFQHSRETGRRPMCAATPTRAPLRPTLPNRRVPGSPDRRRRPTIPVSKLGRSAWPQTAYKVIELIGTSSESWEKAARTAVERAAESLRDLRIAEVTAQDVQLKDGKV